MLSNAQEKLIRALHTKKGRQKHGLCLVEGAKVIETAGEAVEYTFTADDSEAFADLVTTETPQDVAAVARIPEWSLEDVTTHSTIVVLDGVQDPGNVGAILRLCLGFNASLILVDSVDVTNSKVVRSSVGALFQVPWVVVKRDDAPQVLTNLNRPIYRLERSSVNETPQQSFSSAKQLTLIAGSEGQGIHLPVEGTSLSIPQNDALESLNVGHAVAIALATRYAATE